MPFEFEICATPNEETNNLRKTRCRHASRPAIEKYVYYNDRT